MSEQKWVSHHGVMVNNDTGEVMVDLKTGEAVSSHKYQNMIRWLTKGIGAKSVEDVEVPFEEFTRPEIRGRKVNSHVNYYRDWAMGIEELDWDIEEIFSDIGRNASSAKMTPKSILLLLQTCDTFDRYEIFNALNAYRASAGKKPVTLDYARKLVTTMGKVVDALEEYGL